MVSPIRGPLHKTEDWNAGQWWRDITWYQQAKPFNLPLNLRNNWGRVDKLNTTSDGSRWAAFAQLAENPRSYAQAYSRIVDQLGETAGLGITLVQWKEADSMIRSRGRQLLAFNSALMRRSPVGVAASLGISLRKVQGIMGTRYGVARSLSDLWLEFWFGWKPLVSDIYTGCEVFDQDIPSRRYESSARTAVSFFQKAETPFGENIQYSGSSKCRIGVDVRLKNPNTRLLQSFGLLNPLAVAWDAVPWSFVVGWFTNVDSWLSSFTDFAGLELSGTYVAKLTDVHGSTWWQAYPDKGSPGYGVFVTRQNSVPLPQPRLQFKQDLSIRPTRALTAISLLVQKLPR